VAFYLEGNQNIKLVIEVLIKKTNLNQQYVVQQQARIEFFAPFSYLISLTCVKAYYFSN